MPNKEATCRPDDMSLEDFEAAKREAGPAPAHLVRAFAEAASTVNEYLFELNHKFTPLSEEERKVLHQTLADDHTGDTICWMKIMQSRLVEEDIFLFGTCDTTFLNIPFSVDDQYLGQFVIYGEKYVYVGNVERDIFGSKCALTTIPRHPADFSAHTLLSQREAMANDGMVPDDVRAYDPVTGDYVAEHATLDA